MKTKKNIKRTDEDRLLTFLMKTKEGKYAKIEKSSLSFIRVSEKNEFAESSNEECYYYGIS
jgi:hypothetical protein